MKAQYSTFIEMINDQLQWAVNYNESHIDAGNEYHFLFMESGGFSVEEREHVLNWLDSIDDSIDWRLVDFDSIESFMHDYSEMEAENGFANCRPSAVRYAMAAWPVGEIEEQITLSDFNVSSDKARAFLLIAEARDELAPHWYISTNRLRNSDCDSIELYYLSDIMWRQIFRADQVSDLIESVNR